MVLNQTQGRVPIGQETRERVIAAAQELGYSPNPVAQMLARGSNRIIGFFSFEKTFPYTAADFYNPYLVGVQREAGQQGYDVILFTRNQAETPRKVYQDGMNSLRLADGVVLVGNYPDPTELQRLAKENYPFVLVGRCKIPQGEVDTVVNDHTPASYEAARYLIELNHRHLGFLADDLSLAYHQERLAGCQRAVDETPHARLTILNSQALTDSAELKTVIQENGITALIFADRSLVSTAIKLVLEMPLRIPEDLSLLFLVSNTWDLPLTRPTRVSLNRDVVGQVAVQRLVKRLEGALNEYQQTQVSCRFIVGDTTAAR